MKIVFGFVLVAVILLTGITVFANMMKPSKTGGFIGGEMLVAAWLVVAICGAAMWVG